MHKKHNGFVLFLSMIILGLILLVSVLLVSVSISENASQKKFISNFENNMLISQIEYDFYNQNETYFKNHLESLGFTKLENKYTYENYEITINDSYTNIIIYKNSEIVVNLNR